MKIAIVCDWLVTLGGAEKVLAEMFTCFPDADLFAVVDFLPDDKRDFVLHKRAKTSFIQQLPFAKTSYRAYLPLMPLAIEQLDLSAYDLILSSSHAVAKGVITGPNQTHISYVHSPMRYAWDLQHQYLRETGLDRKWRGHIARYLLHKLRLWDVSRAHGVDHFIANSNYIARRIHKTYQREATVIYPPINVEQFTPGGKKEDFYLTASRFVPYKRIDLIVESFSRMPDKRLLVIGDGPDYHKIKAKAGSNVSLLGHQSTIALIDHMQRAKAFLFAAEEDFGIVPLEALACGTPVIAYGKGGALETVRGLDQDKPTGVFFYEQTVDALVDAMTLFENEEARFTKAHCVEQAARFSPAKFRENFKRFILERTAQ
ncbi:MAG: glycosyl transferase family 1 [Gammaproteobacteria bacterium RIFCSPHIGHO2_12_FULL_43_28]|nr:MAG: glycosyl transferase family 1 [Gammaproteobacteria bacterium RIFCSPHIGHO2_12_FULL_43_28]